MCGIAGLAGCSDKALLKRMCKLISHRGPNHTGYHLGKGISMGYNRLAIIDLKSGNQPIYSDNGNLAIVFNGEIYNYLFLKEELEKRGHRFKTNSDTETILRGYEQWGPEIANKLRGMFAFAIWDGKRKRLFIARDKFGKKPLYYAQINRMLGFASEIKSLLLLPNFNKALDYKAIDEFLAYRFIPSPRTIFKGVRKLPPGHYLIWQDGNLSIKPYWRLQYSPQQHSEEHFAKRVRELLDEAVRIRLMSEVPLGAYLSGGIDSSGVVALMAAHSDQPVKTFSVGFGVEKYDELPFARKVAEEFSTDHHEIIVSPKSIKELPKIIWHLDEPMADPTSIPTYLLSKFAKRKVTVVLTGEGGDEIFGGYEQYKIMQLAYTHGRKIPQVLRKHVIPHAVRAIPKNILDLFFKYSSALGKKGIERFSHFISDLGEPEKSYLELVQIFDKQERESLYLHEELDAADLSRNVGKFFKPTSSRGDLLAQMQLFDVATELPDDLLMKVDKMTMAASVEARAPLLDVPLAELAFTIPSSMKIKNSTEKYILRKALADILPKPILQRKKMRFFVPIDYWFGGDLKGIAENLLLESDRKLFKRKEVRKILQGYDNSRAYAARQLWNLISLELWCRIYLDRGLRKQVSLEELIGG